MDNSKLALRSRIIRPRECETLVGLCSVHIARLEAQGIFPKRFKISPGAGRHGAAGWRLGDIIDWIDARAATAGSDAA